MASTLYPPFLTHKPHHFFLTLPIKPRSTITCQDSSKPSTTSTNDPTINPIITTTDQPNKPPPQPVVSSSGQGFGPAQPNKKKKGEKKREGSKVIRRAPVRKTELLGVEGGEVAKERSKGEEAFVLAWLGFGGLVLVEGVALAASGFLPEEWDKFFVKFLYPIFTPTVFLFVAGTVAYGVLKYLENENLENKK